MFEQAAQKEAEEDAEVGIPPFQALVGQDSSDEEAMPEQGNSARDMPKAGTPAFHHACSCAQENLKAATPLTPFEASSFEDYCNWTGRGVQEGPFL